jgi:uncharacterized membrane protein
VPGPAVGQGRAGRQGRRRDAGTILLLTLGYAMLAIALVVVVVDVSAVYLARRNLAAACDGASLAAAQRVDETALYTSGGDVRVLPLDSAETISAEVAAYRDRTDASGRTQLTGTLQDGTTVVVAGTRSVELPVVGVLGIHPVTVRAQAQAQTVVRGAGAAP